MNDFVRYWADLCISAVAVSLGKGLYPFLGRSRSRHQLVACDPWTLESVDPATGTPPH